MPLPCHFQAMFHFTVLSDGRGRVGQVMARVGVRLGYNIHIILTLVAALHTAVLTEQHC